MKVGVLYTQSEEYRGMKQVIMQHVIQRHEKVGFMGVMSSGSRKS
jgi:hypothetical protein